MSMLILDHVMVMVMEIKDNGNKIPDENLMQLASYETAGKDGATNAGIDAKKMLNTRTLKDQNGNDLQGSKERHYNI